MATVTYKQGDRVFHTHFGRGTITEVVADDRVKVYFVRMGEKTFDLNYAPLRLATFEDEQGEYTNKARVLYVHYGRDESHVVLQIGHLYLPAHMFEYTDLNCPANAEEAFGNTLISVNLTIYNASVEPYEPAEDNPLFGIHKRLWKDGVIGRINVSTEVFVRRPDSMTNSLSSPIDWRAVAVEGCGEIFDLDEDGDPVINSCGVVFCVDIEPCDHPAAHLKKGDLVTFKGFLAAD